MDLMILVAVLGCALFVLLISLIQQRRSSQQLRQQIVRLEEQLKQTQRPPERFSQTLVQVERSAPLPKPHQNQQAADRYRHISAMARQGMGAVQIAAALQIGEAEAAQIVRLSRLQQRAES